MSSSGFEQRFEDHINELRLFSSCEDRDFEETLWDERKLWKAVPAIEHFMSRLGLEACDVDTLGFNQGQP